MGAYGSTVLPARVCAIRTGSVQCKEEDGAFGAFVWSLGEDSSGTVWAGADSGVWRLKPDPAQRYPTPGLRVGDLLKSDDGRLLVGMSGAGLKQLVARQARTVSYSQRDEPKCATCGPRGRFEQAIAGP